jgi:uncharacterized membrane-anchored protein YhcB (DUF1043 family)
METAPGMVMEIVIGAALLVAGFLIGLFIGRSRDAGTRIRDLEREVERLRQEGATYREAVAKHFGEASDKFRDLTRQYGQLYKHLAEGARDLCGDVPAIRFDQSTLLEDASGGSERPAGSDATAPESSAGDAEKPAAS